MHPALQIVAEAQFGAFTAAQARQATYPPDEIRRLVSAGRWARLRRGVYAEAARLPDPDDARGGLRITCMALQLELSRPAARFGHDTALRLLGIPSPRRGPRQPLRLTDPHGWRRGRDFLVTQAPVDPSERFRLGPLRITSPARALVDCAREWGLVDAVIALDAALLTQEVSAADLAHAVERCARWPGAARARRAVDLSDSRAESPLETKGRLRLVGAGLTPTDLQVEIRVHGRLVAVVDAWYERQAVALEVDGKVKYTDPWRGRTPAQVMWEEKEREDDLRSLGIRVGRLTGSAVGRGWPVTEDRLRAMLREDGPPVRGFTATARPIGVPRTA